MLRQFSHGGHVSRRHNVTREGESGIKSNREPSPPHRLASPAVDASHQLGSWRSMFCSWHRQATGEGLYEYDLNLLSRVSIK